MRFGVLGPLFMAESEASVVPTAPKQRQLLALLLVNANQIVPISDCLEELWEHNPPSSAVPTLQTYIMQLRRRLRSAASSAASGSSGGSSGGSAGGASPASGAGLPCARRLVTKDRGYAFVVQPGELDCEVFEERIRQGRAALNADDHGRAARLLREALALWRGPALVDVQVGPLLQARLAGLEESRLSALQQRIEADLRLGRHHDLLSELRVLTGRHPVDENLHAQLILALYRSGRQVDALQVYQRLCRVLADELGLAPSPRMRRLHEAVLSSDPILDLPAPVRPRFALDLAVSVRARPSAGVGASRPPMH